MDNYRKLVYFVFIGHTAKFWTVQWHAFHRRSKLRASALMANKNRFHVWLVYTFPVVPTIATLTFNLKKRVTALWKCKLAKFEKKKFKLNGMLKEPVLSWVWGYLSPHDELRSDRSSVETKALRYWCNDAHHQNLVVLRKEKKNTCLL